MCQERTWQHSCSQPLNKLLQTDKEQFEINSQNLEDTQVGYISQKYTLDKYSLEKYTLGEATLGK